MLAVSPLRDTIKDEKQGEMENSFSCGGGDGFPDFGDSNLLDSIDFDDLFIVIGDGDVLPDLEMDHEILADFAVSSTEDYSDINTAVLDENPVCAADQNSTKLDEDDKVSASDSGSGLINSSPSGEEIVSKRDDSVEGLAMNPTPTSTTSAKDGDKGGRKVLAAAQLKNSQGKRKVKVDWTPELHRRFVQAVEQLGVDKAVPSRILEIMGIDCLTRHNIASHLQKYRSHRKHLLAREAEAASWSQRRQMYGTAAAAKRDLSLWPTAAPTMGFPPMTPPPPPPPIHHFRPLHVWGHPTVDQSLMHAWPPKHLAHSPNPPPPPPPQAAWPPDPSYSWHSHQHQRVPNALTPGTPCFPQPLAAAPRLIGRPGAVAAGIIPAVATQPHGVYKVENRSHPNHQAPNSSISTTTLQSAPSPHPLINFLPSKESIDAAIGDVLAKPWLPLPLGLKPPSTDSVMVELQRQGVPNVPPSCA